MKSFIATLGFYRRITKDIEMQIVRIASENPDWGYERIVGALDNIDYQVSDTTVANLSPVHTPRLNITRISYLFIR